jgi:predicted esterase
MNRTLCLVSVVTMTVPVLVAQIAQGGEFSQNGYRVWFPDSATQVRGVFVHRKYGGGDRLYSRPSWRTFATKIQFGHVVMPQNKKAPVTPRQAVADLKNLNAFLDAAAKATKRSELRMAKFIALGISRGGANAIAMAYAAPKQSIAAMGYHGISVVGIHTMAKQNAGMPVYYTMASLDPPGKRRNPVIENYVRTVMRGRLGAPWTIKIDRGAKHTGQPDDELVFAWMEDVVGIRLGKNGSLKPVDWRQSWGAQYSPVNLNSDKIEFANVTVGRFSKSNYRRLPCWLPSKRTASIFQTMHSTDKTAERQESPTHKQP